MTKTHCVAWVIAAFIGIVDSHADDSLVSLSSQVAPSIVHLQTTTGAGTGFVVTKDLVVTNHHVIDGCSSLRVKFRGGTFADADGVRYIDERRDIAIIQVTTRDELMHAIDVSSSLPKQGQDVAAFGNPQGFEFSVTRGIISGIRTSDEMTRLIPGRDWQGTWLQTDAAISSGNSGGPLVDSAGKVVAMNTFQRLESQNLNLAISCIDIADAIKLARAARLQSFSDIAKGRPTHLITPGVSSIITESRRALMMALDRAISMVDAGTLGELEAGNLVNAFRSGSAADMSAGQVVRLKGSATVIQVLDDGMQMNIDGVTCFILIIGRAPEEIGELRAKIGLGVVPGVEIDNVFVVQKAVAYRTVQGREHYLMPLIPANVLVALEDLRGLVAKEREKRKYAVLEAERQKKERMVREAERNVQDAIAKLTKTFADSSGKFKVDAVAIGIKDDVVQLFRLKEKSVIDVSVARLSEADQEWIVRQRRFIVAAGPSVRRALMEQ